MVTMRHIRAARLCSRGTRTFFQRHGLDWVGFLRHGIAAERLEGTGDAMAIEVALIARQEAADE
jgi:hypothetical protein